MIPVLHLHDPAQRQQAEDLLRALRLNASELATGAGPYAQAAQAAREVLADVAARGDAAVVDNSRRFDDPAFTADRMRVSAQEMAQAAQRLPEPRLRALRRSIAQVRAYQSHILPRQPEPLRRPGVELGLRFTPLASAGLLIPGGKASYPSSLIMLAAPAQAAGVSRIVACTPPSAHGRSDLLLAAAHELGLTEFYFASGAAAVGALAFGTATIAAVDKIVGPGNVYVQMAKRAVAGSVGVDGFLGPSEILILADQTGRADFIAADMIAQAEHDPGSCFLLTTSPPLAQAVAAQLAQQLKARRRATVIATALAQRCAIIVDASMDRLLELADRFAAEHVSLQTADDTGIAARLHNAGAIFLGKYSPVAAGDYVAGPSHCLPTNTTARFASGVSVYEFLKRTSVVRYEAQGLAADAPAIIELAEAEGLDGHAESIRLRHT